MNDIILIELSNRDLKGLIDRLKPQKVHFKEVPATSNQSTGGALFYVER